MVDDDLEESPFFALLEEMHQELYHDIADLKKEIKNHLE